MNLYINRYFYWTELPDILVEVEIEDSYNGIYAREEGEVVIDVPLYLQLFNWYVRIPFLYFCRAGDEIDLTDEERSEAEAQFLEEQRDAAIELEVDSRLERDLD